MNFGWAENEFLNGFCFFVHWRSHFSECGVKHEKKQGPARGQAEAGGQPSGPQAEGRQAIQGPTKGLAGQPMAGHEAKLGPSNGQPWPRQPRGNQGSANDLAEANQEPKTTTGQSCPKQGPAKGLPRIKDNEGSSHGRPRATQGRIKHQGQPSNMYIIQKHQKVIAS